jgi:hypothetical protein
MRTSALAAAALIGWTAAGLSVAQEAPPPTPTPAAAEAAAEGNEAEAKKKEKPAYRPIESNVIINLPSVEVPPAGTLTFLVTHRFTSALQNGDIDNFFTLDEGNEWGFGLWYSPVKRLNVGFFRTSSVFDDYEASAEYQLPSLGGFGSAIRVGEDWRTDSPAASPKSSFFAQAALAYSFGPYVRLTAVPTFVTRTNRFFTDEEFPVPNDLSCRPSGNPLPAPQYVCSGLYDDVFNVPVGLSIAITHSITVHGEVTPALSAVNSSGVGWAVTVEKSLLRHRFAFFVGNQRATTVDQYVGAVPRGRNPGDIYIGFNLYRAWKLN